MKVREEEGEREMIREDRGLRGMNGGGNDTNGYLGNSEAKVSWGRF